MGRARPCPDHGRFVMHRTVFLILGALQFAVAVVLGVLGYLLPGPEAAYQGAKRVDALLGRAAERVLSLEKELQEVRSPEYRRLLREIQMQLPALKSRLNPATVNFDAVRAAGQSLEHLARLLDHAARAVEP